MSIEQARAIAELQRQLKELRERIEALEAKQPKREILTLKNVKTN